MFAEVGAFLFAVVIWYLRCRCNRAGALKDLRWFLFSWLALTPWSSRRWVYKVCIFVGCSWYTFHAERQQQKRNNAAVGGEVRKSPQEPHHGINRSRSDHSDAWSLMKPAILPCRTSHTRLFPQKHCFSYSYLYVGIPVGWCGSVSNVLSADLKCLPWDHKPPDIGWLDVDSADYLARGEHLHGLQGKLIEYLESQNEKMEDYPYAYLVTAPRFLGYSFNPVSFWYLYNGNKELKAMILEVNNTFDEKRMYLLKDRGPSETGPGDEMSASQEPGVTANEKHKPPLSDEKVASRFSAAWQKDFHVSPFNSRKGAYSLSAIDPLVNRVLDGNLTASCGQIRNTITLSSSKNHPKLIARVFSTSDSIDPSALGKSQFIRFVLSWWWVGFVTFPRIVREAGKLFFRRKLHVWYRPEVLKDSLGRNETEDERAIAVIFRDYLKTLVEDSNISTSLQYTSSIATLPPSETFTPHSLPSTSPPTPLIFKTPTPLFYALLARQNDFPAFLRTTLTNQERDPKTAIFYTSNSNLLLQLFEDANTQRKETKPSYPTPIDSIRWRLIRHLRNLRLHSTSSTSPLDDFAMGLPIADAYQVRKYRLATLKLLMSDYLAFGMPGVIDAGLALVRLWLCWICVQSVEDAIVLCEKSEQPSLYALLKIVLGCLGMTLWAAIGAVL